MFKFHAEATKLEFGWPGTYVKVAVGGQ